MVEMRTSACETREWEGGAHGRSGGFILYTLYLGAYGRSGLYTLYFVLGSPRPERGLYTLYFVIGSARPERGPERCGEVYSMKYEV